MDPAHVIISDNSRNPPMKSGRDRLHGKLVMYRALIIYRLNTRILGDLHCFHVEKGALFTDHVEYKLPITFHGGTPDHVSRRKKYINHNSRWKFQANHASRGWPLPPPPPYMYGVVSHIWKKNLLVRSGSDVTGSRLSPSNGGTLGSTWQDMVSQQLATGWW